MSLNLESTRKYVEGQLMDDNVLIYRDPEEEQDDDWDSGTGTYTTPLDDYDLIYDGRCYITFIGSVVEETQGGQEVIVAWYNLNIPINAPPILNYDLVICNAAVRDAKLVGMAWLVQLEEHGTFKVKQKIRMRQVKRVP